MCLNSFYKPDEFIQQSLQKGIPNTTLAEQDTCNEKLCSLFLDVIWECILQSEYVTSWVLVHG